jgi:hypothetical protein
MIAREKMLNAMIDCKPTEFTYSEMERLAKTDTYEMIDDFVMVMYDLHTELIDKTNELDEFRLEVKRMNRLKNLL